MLVLPNKYNKNSSPHPGYDLILMQDIIPSHLGANSPVAKRMVAVDFERATTLPPQSSESCFKRFLMRVWSLSSGRFETTISTGWLFDWKNGMQEMGPLTWRNRWGAREEILNLAWI